MKRIWMFPTILLLFSFGCENYKPQHGEPTINEETMTKMVTDIHLIEAHMQNIDASDRDSVKTVMYQALFNRYNIDTAEFYQNRRMYFSNPDAVESLYEKVLQRLDTISVD